MVLEIAKIKTAVYTLANVAGIQTYLGSPVRLYPDLAPSDVDAPYAVHRVTADQDRAFGRIGEKGMITFVVVSLVSSQIEISSIISAITTVFDDSESTFSVTGYNTVEFTRQGAEVLPKPHSKNKSEWIGYIVYRYEIKKDK